MSETLRPAQAAVLRYTGGKMAVPAVPGAGKTFILTRLAVRLVEDLGVSPRRILILTYMRGAAQTFRTRIANMLKDRGLAAYGLSVMTIHAFALSLLKQHYARFDDPDEGVDGLSLLTESEQAFILQEGLRRYELTTPLNLPAATEYNDPREEIVVAAAKVISAAKFFGRSPDDIAPLLNAQPEVVALYRHYQEVQARENKVDYDDVVIQAVQLMRDPEIRRLIQARFQYVLEDEAQDSTPAQHQLLSLLTDEAHGGSGNLVRVGDTNQAIMATFTFNDPRYFRDFCQSLPESRRIALPESSRSGQPIMDLANHLVQVAEQHPDPAVAKAFVKIEIRPATEGALNPDAGRCGCFWKSYKLRNDEIDGVLEQVIARRKRFPDETMAVLCARRLTVKQIAERAKLMGIAIAEEETDKSRGSDILLLFHRVLVYLSLPDDRAALQGVLEATFPFQGGLVDRKALVSLLPGGGDEFVFPPLGLPPWRPAGADEGDYARLVEVGKRLAVLLKIRHLPLAELLPSVAVTFLPGDPYALQVAAHVARRLRTRHTGEPFQPLADEDRWYKPSDPLQACLDTLKEMLVSSKGRALLPVSSELKEIPDDVLRLGTLHSAKGAEYDAVWMPNLGYAFKQEKTDFPWDPQEVRADLKRWVAQEAIRLGKPVASHEVEWASRCEVVAEKLRLLYVGITRARLVLHLSAYGEPPPVHIQRLAQLCTRM